MKDYRKAKDFLLQEYARRAHRSPEELHAFEEGLNSLVGYLDTAKDSCKIVVAMDSFKGSLTARQCCAAVAQGILNARKEAEVVQLPISDGGEGLLDICTPRSEERINLSATGPVQEPIDTCYGITPNPHQTAIIETARIIGLPLVPPPLRNPWHTTSYGVGEVIRDALQRGYRHFLIGLGGSSTNDAGLGMLQALGYRFYDRYGKWIEQKLCGGLLNDVADIDGSGAHPLLKEARFTLVCDVTNPLYGSKGAARVFAPQKGADEAMVEKLDEGLQHIGALMKRIIGRDIAFLTGAGAAGGLGAAFMAFLNAEWKFGIEYILERQHFDEFLPDADLVITGEGRSDNQTLMGKVPQGVLKVANRYQVPVVLLSGSVTQVRELNQAGFLGVFSILQEPMPLSEAMKAEMATRNLRITAEQVCRTILGRG